MIRRYLIVAVVILPVIGATEADEPKPKAIKPPYQRLLTGEEAKKATDLEQRITKLQAADMRSEALKLAEELLALREGMQGKDHWQVMDARLRIEDLGQPLSVEKKARLAEVMSLNARVTSLYQNGKSADAIPLAQKSLALVRESRGGDHLDAAISLNNLASIYLATNRYAEAEAFFKDALRIKRKTLGEDHPDTANSLSNLAYVYRAQIRYAEAEPLLKDALRIKRWTLGDEHTSTANSLNDLAGLYREQARYAEAEPLLNDALRIRRKAFGDEHASTAISLNNLANLYVSQARYAEAEPLLNDALRIKRKALGAEHLNIAGTLDDLAGLYRVVGRYVEAETLLKDSLRIKRKSLGDEHGNTAFSMNILAGVYREMGRYTEAETLFKDSLRVYRKAVGDDHPNTASSMNNLANLYRDLGNFVEAEPLYKDSLRISRKSRGDDHPETAKCMSNLALLYQSQGRYTEAEPLHHDALRILRQSLGDNHTETAKSISSLALLYQDQNRYEKAEALHKEALRVYRKALAENHPYTANSLNNLADLYFHNDRFAEAEILHKEALEIRRKILGDNHPATANSLNNLAEVCCALARFAEAESMHKEALRIRCKTLGDNHPATASSLSNLAGMYHDQRRYAEAEPLLTQATSSFESARLSAATGLDRSIATGFSPYLTLMVNAAMLGKPRDALSALEMNLGRGLLDEMATRRPNKLTADERERRDRLVGELGGLQSRVLYLASRPLASDDEKSELDRLTRVRTKLEAEISELSVAVSRRELTDLASLQRVLPPDAAWVAWVDFNDRTGRSQEHWACVVRHSGDPHWERLPGSEAGGKWTEADSELPWRLRFAIAGQKGTAEQDKGLPSPPPSEVDVDALARRLGAQRVAPVLKHLAGVNTLYVSATGPMAGVPVDVLAPGYTISYVPSGTFLARLSERAKPDSGGILALGDPNFARPGDKPAAEKPLPPGGLLITVVAPEGAAAKAHLQPGDVLLKYGNVELGDFASFQKAIDANADKKTVAIVVWRAETEKSLIRDVAPGKLGVVFAADPAPIALANRRKLDAAVAVRGGDLDELPGTRVEIDRLKKLFGDRATVLADSDASEQKLDRLRRSGELAKYRYLHLATHGQGNTVKALESCLMLARDKLPDDILAKDNEPLLDGRLTAREVLNFWKLDAELVTLSACETAIGREAGGDGLLGFAQAFLTAGSRSVCLSLWRVDDRATSLLMDRFYQNLLSKRNGLTVPMGKAAALAEAKAWLRELSWEEMLKHTAAASNGVVRGPGQKPLALAAPKEEKPAKGEKPFAHPKYWAAFILVGDPN